jgi:transketolase
MSLGNLYAKLESFGWKVLKMDGNVMEEVLDTLKHAISLTGNNQPIAIMMHTIMGKGVDFMEDNHKWHGVAPNKDQIEKALGQLEETLGDF